mmetsp:Transcript_27918/g.70629  ORF Transcript_27918/g.70629 Transcript_27918/m.70629 type:complete len:216 (+) Transcript_27918:77-724(+)
MSGRTTSGQRQPLRRAMGVLALVLGACALSSGLMGSPAAAAHVLPRQSDHEVETATLPVAIGRAVTFAVGAQIGAKFAKEACRRGCELAEIWLNEMASWRIANCEVLPVEAAAADATKRAQRELVNTLSTALLLKASICILAMWLLRSGCVKAVEIRVKKSGSESDMSSYSSMSSPLTSPRFPTSPVWAPLRQRQLSFPLLSVADLWQGRAQLLT